MTITKKLYLAVGAVTITLIGLALFSIMVIREIKVYLADIQGYPEIQALLGTVTINHYRWANALEETTFLGKEFTGQIDHTKCTLGQWYYSFTPPKELEDVYKKIEEPHRKLHATASRIIGALKKRDRTSALKIYQGETKPVLEQTEAS